MTFTKPELPKNLFRINTAKEEWHLVNGIRWAGIVENDAAPKFRQPILAE